MITEARAMDEGRETSYVPEVEWVYYAAGTRFERTPFWQMGHDNRYFIFLQTDWTAHDPCYEAQGPGYYRMFATLEAAKRELVRHRIRVGVNTLRGLVGA